MITAVIILVIAYIAKGIRDRIKFRPDDFWFVRNKKLQNWILARGEFGHEKRTWLTKYVFSFLADGWHFFDSVCVLCVCVLLTMLTGLVWWSAIAFYFGGGVLFEITYNIKIR